MTAAALERIAQGLERTRLHHHLEGLAQQIVADQHARLIAPDDACRLLAAPQIALIDDIVMKQRRGVHELDRGCELDMLLAAIAAHPRRRERQHRADAFAARIDQVAGNFRDEFHMDWARARIASLTLPMSACGQTRQRLEAGRGSQCCPSNGMTTPMIATFIVTLLATIGALRSERQARSAAASKVLAGSDAEFGRLGGSQRRCYTGVRTVARRNDLVLSLLCRPSARRRPGSDLTCSMAHMSAVEGSIGAIPRRLMVADDELSQPRDACSVTPR